jgi:DNA-binding GntR family transcriptional regulator
MQLSTMPVREALVRLEEAGLVYQEPRKGARVSRLSLEDLQDFYNLRRLIEPPSIQMGIERMTPDRLTRLRSTMAELESAAKEADLVTVLDLDEDLLALVHAAAVNKQLERVIKSTWAQVRAYKLLFTMTQANAGDYIARDNAGLIDAAGVGDASGARDWMDKSLANAHLQLDDLLRSYQAGDLTPTYAASVDDREPLANIIARLASAADGEN